MQDIDWNDLRTLAALHRQGSYARAARELGVAETTVERRIRRLETRLGSALLGRQGGRLALTDAGLALIGPAEAAEQAFEAAVDRVRGRDRRAAGQVRLSTVPLLAHHVLAPALPSLLAAHPDLVLDLAAESHDVSLARREADIALRFAQPVRDADALTRKVAALAFGLYAAEPQRGRVRFLRYADTLNVPVNGWIDANRRPGDADAGLVVSDGETLVAAARAGVGVALLPRVVGDRLSGLTRLDRPCDLVREVWTVVPRAIRHQARIVQVLSWIGAVLDHSTRDQF